MSDLEQYDYEKGEFQDDCFKINAIPLNILPTSNDFSQLKKFPDDLIYAYLCEVCLSIFLSFLSLFLLLFRPIHFQRHYPRNYVLFMVCHRKNVVIGLDEQTVVMFL